MFPRIRQTVLARADLFVELVTLGEYGLDEHGAPLALRAAGPELEPAGASLVPQPRGSRTPAGVSPSQRPQPADCASTPRLRDRRRDRCTLCAGAPEPCLTARAAGAPTRP